jgi:hypothetical protein
VIYMLRVMLYITWRGTIRVLTDINGCINKREITLYQKLFILNKGTFRGYTRTFLLNFCLNMAQNCYIRECIRVTIGIIRTRVLGSLYCEWMTQNLPDSSRQCWVTRECRPFRAFYDIFNSKDGIKERNGSFLCRKKLHTDCRHL